MGTSTGPRRPAPLAELRERTYAGADDDGEQGGDERKAAHVAILSKFTFTGLLPYPLSLVTSPS